MKDPKHWAWYIFENIRRACATTQKSLTSLFGLQNVQFKGLDDKINIGKDQFMYALKQMGIPVSMDHERQLMDLLHSNQASNWEIDFVHFSELVGIHYLASEFQQLTMQAL